MCVRDYSACGWVLLNEYSEERRRAAWDIALCPAALGKCFNNEAHSTLLDWFSLRVGAVKWVQRR